MTGKGALVVIDRSTKPFLKTLVVRIELQTALAITLIEKSIRVFLPTESVERAPRGKVPRLMR